MSQGYDDLFSDTVRYQNLLPPRRKDLKNHQYTSTDALFWNSHTRVSPSVTLQDILYIILLQLFTIQLQILQFFLQFIYNSITNSSNFVIEMHYRRPEPHQNYLDKMSMWRLDSLSQWPLACDTMFSFSHLVFLFLGWLADSQAPCTHQPPPQPRSSLQCSPAFFGLAALNAAQTSWIQLCVNLKQARNFRAWKFKFCQPDTKLQELKSFEITLNHLKLWRQLGYWEAFSCVCTYPYGLLTGK